MSLSYYCIEIGPLALGQLGRALRESAGLSVEDAAQAFLPGEDSLGVQLAEEGKGGHVNRIPVLLNEEFGQGRFVMFIRRDERGAPVYRVYVPEQATPVPGIEDALSPCPDQPPPPGRH